MDKNTPSISYKDNSAIDAEFKSPQIQQKIIELRNTIKDNSQYQKNIFEKNWFRSILFFIGNQWVQYYQSSRKWERPRKMPEWFPTPVTNKFARIMNTIIAILIQKDPVPVITPQTDSDKDIAAAGVADQLVPVMDKETGMDTFRKIASSWYVLTGNIFCHSYAYNNKANKGSAIPKERCAQCGQVFTQSEISKAGDMCPECKGVEFSEAKDEMGNPILEEYGKTQLKRDPCSAFEIHCEQQIQDIKDLANFVRTKTIPMEELKKMYPDFADEIVADSTGSSRGQDYLNTLAFTASGAGSGDTTQLISGPSAGRKDKRSSLDYVYQLPTKDFPNGVVATLNGSNVFEAMPLNEIYIDKDKKPFLPLAFAGHTFVPGRLWHKSVADDLMEKQQQRNKLECYIELITYGMTRPHWLIPDVCGDLNIGGPPGQKIKYTHGPNGEKPSMERGVDVPASLVQRLEQIDKEFDDLAATYDALKGQSPTNINTYSGLKLLTERGYSSHLGMIRNWESFMGEITLQGLNIMRNIMVENRSSTFKNEMGEWETKQFQQADIEGGMDINIEAGSSIPRSQTAEQAALVDSVKLGLIDISDPGTHYKVLEELGQSQFKNDVDIDVKDAKQEWSDFIETGKTRPRLGIDDEVIHLKDAARRAKTDQFFQLSPDMQKAWIEHVGYHDANVKAEQARQAAMGQVNPAQDPNRQKADNPNAPQLNIEKSEFQPS